jgi:hypothetical protein
VDGGVAAEGRGAGAGGDGLRVLAAGLSQVGVEVDQAGQGDEPPGLDRLVAGQFPADVGHDPVADQDVPRLSAEDARALDDDAAH